MKLTFAKVTAPGAVLAGAAVLALGGAATAAPAKTSGVAQFFGTQQGNKATYE